MTELLCPKCGGPVKKGGVEHNKQRYLCKKHKEAGACKWHGTKPVDAARLAAQQGDAPEYDITHPLPAGLVLKGTSIRYDGAGEVQQYWNKSRLAGRELEDVTHIPDPKKITKTATLYDQQGRVTQQWVAEKPEDVAKEALWQAFAEALKADLPRLKPRQAPPAPSNDLAACYPVGDHHIGMLSWRPETGADYDLKIAESLLLDATAHLIGVTPRCETALIALLGDFFHYDGFEAKTPTSGNLLDADSRYPKMVGVALRSIRNMIDMALERHQKVHVIVEIGNHDLSTSIFLAQCLALVYESEPRVAVDISPSHFHYFEFGNCLVGTHHGHGVKMEQLPLVMAADRREAWGRTKHRYWWTGHIHHSKTKSVVSAAEDFAGCSVESFRILAPTDAWAAQKGFRSTRDMKAIVLHREHGEVARHTVNPAMIE